MSEPLRIGIVGCGNIADNHYQAFSEFPDTEVVAVCDLDVDRASAYARDRGIDRAVGSVGDLLSAGVDAISVCTPHPTHEAVVIAAAEAGVHILCEKPLAVQPDSAARMVAAAEERGVVLDTVFQRRYWPAAQRIRSAVDEGLLGVPMLGHCQVLLSRGADYYSTAAWRGTWAADGGGVLMTQAIHYIDLLQWFMGDPVEVSARAGTFVHSEHIEVEDTASAVITFASGAVATLSATVAAKPNLGTRISVTGTSGATVGLAEYPEGNDAVNDVWAVPGQEQAVSVLDDGFRGPIPVQEVNQGLKPMHALQLADFVNAVRKGEAPAVPGTEAMKSLQIVTAAYESARTGAPARIGSATPRPSEPTLFRAAVPPPTTAGRTPEQT